jgi:guanylate kinase
MGRLLILEGPSGAGKTEAMKLLVRNTPVVKPITCTTRDMRPGEVNGIDYHFLTEQEFVKGMENGEFIETIVYAGNRYGTRYKDLMKLIEQDMDVVLIMEINGAKKIKETFPEFTEIVHLERPFEELVMAILERNIPNEDKRDRIVQLQNDMKVAEMDCIDHRVFNETGKLDETAQKIYELLKK